MPKKGTTDEFSLYVYSETTQHVVKNCAGRAMQFSVKPLFAFCVTANFFVRVRPHNYGICKHGRAVRRRRFLCFDNRHKRCTQKKNFNKRMPFVTFCMGRTYIVLYEKRVFGQGTFCGNRRYWYECAGATSCTLRLRRQRQ